MSNQRAGLVIRAGLTEELNRKVQNAQKVVDSEILRCCEPFVPKKTGNLARSGIMGTRIGSGKVRYIAPYAKKQYYRGKANQQRGRFWFERAKNANKTRILSLAQAEVEK